MFPLDDERRKAVDLLAGLDDIDRSMLDIRDPFMLPPIVDMGWQTVELDSGNDGTRHRFGVGMLEVELGVKPGVTELAFDSRNPFEFSPGNGFEAALGMYKNLFGRFPGRFYNLSPDPDALVKRYSEQSRIELGRRESGSVVFKMKDYKDIIAFASEYGDHSASEEIKSLKVFGSIPSFPEVEPGQAKNRSFVLNVDFPYSQISPNHVSLKIINANQGYQAWNQSLVEWVLANHRYGGVFDSSTFALSARALSVMIQDRVRVATG